SPDSQRVAYTAGRDGKWFVVADGRLCTRYDLLGDSLVAFSPDSRHIGYLAANEGKQFVVVDLTESKPFIEFLRGTRVVFDDATHLHTLARRDDDLYRSEHFRVEMEIR